MSLGVDPCGKCGGEADRMANGRVEITVVWDHPFSYDLLAHTYVCSSCVEEGPTHITIDRPKNESGT